MSDPDINNDIAEMIRVAGEDWAEKDAACYLLHESKTAVLAKQVNDYIDATPGTAYNRAESSVKGSRRWFDHLESMSEARKQANLARIRYDALRAQLNVWQTRNQMKRAEQWANKGV